MPEQQAIIEAITDLYREGLTVIQIAHYLSLNPDFVREKVKPLLTEDTGYDDYDPSNY